MSRSGHDDSLRADVVEDVAELEALAPAWDELAAAAGCPGALSGWQLSWWRHLAPPSARLRAVAVYDDERLVGLAPWYVEPSRRRRAVYRLLAAPLTHRVEPLAEPARVAPVAAAIAYALAAATPAPDYLAFDGADAQGLWCSAVTGGWPGRLPWSLHEREAAAPVLDLRHDDFETWLKDKSSNFRQQARRFRRRLAEAGGRVRMSSTQDELAADVAAFARLHNERWSDRGGSSLHGDVEGMLLDAARALLPGERLRLWIVEVEGRPVSAQVFLATGGNALYWNGGFDPAAARLKPALLGILAGVEDCFARGERRLDLGGGAHDYKLRIADRDLPLSWGGLVPRERRYVRNRIALVPLQLRGVARRAYRSLPPDLQKRTRTLVGAPARAPD